ncbi:Type I inositol 1,4,5-trisphosphate 5-phosphatase CVP2 [Acorus calamus]|uniref:Type I inositol 1,4,5-trisphosphate 5-phosphatase CVP2 n=1 Tax=Acorus calamus TaxID=4465 RepID=A0AAV9DP96_ACOCL|nr:Type I inositol 1,4,5-trisphosphate 5-phosphatase CVP2 [Acorus calamus]
MKENQKETHMYKVLINTWNVGGVTPADDLNMEDLLDTDIDSCDMYVFGSHEHKERQKVHPVKEVNSEEEEEEGDDERKFRCMVSKQMVGIFVSVWVREGLRGHIRHMSVSCVGCGIMGCLGNKLRLEVAEGQTFEGWQEGGIGFSPTYKYYPNSNEYYGSSLERKGEKRRAPAWCDRILWWGEGLKQTRYSRGESRLSDHRPVRAVFVVEVESSRNSSTSLETFFSSERFDSVEVFFDG